MASFARVCNPSKLIAFSRAFPCVSKCLSVTSRRWASDGDKFSRFPVPEVEKLPSDLKDKMLETQDKAGFIPNVFSALSHRPDELRAFLHYYDVVMADRGNLTKADKEMIIVATSATNRCQYCIVAHGALHRIYSKNPYLADQLAANWETANLDDRQLAILDVAMDICDCEPITDDQIEELKNHGLNMEDLWDIGSVTSLFALSNRMAYTMNLKPNTQFYLMGRVPREKK